ncbi:MAG: hypothetical protein ACXABN_00805 [Candidatus Thorarchaeota archaeon]|jgi:hypothetical protein
MASSRISGDIGSTDFVYLTLYRLRIMNDEDKKKWFKAWNDIKSHLPKGMKMITEATSAFGTEYTGFTVYEGPLDKFEELVDRLEEYSEGFVEKSLTIIGTKGFALPIAEFQKIIDKRPVD